MENLTNPQSNGTRAAEVTEQPNDDLSEFHKYLDEQKQQSEEQTRKNEAALAAKLHLRREFGELHATYRWFSWKRLLIDLPGAVLFMLFGGGFVWGAFFWFEIAPPWDRADFLLMIVSGGMAIAGLWAMYRTIALLVNRTTIEVVSDQLSIRHGPLPYPGNRSVQRSELKEIRTEQTSKAGIPLFLPVEGAGTGLTPKASFHQLRAILKDGREFNLVYGSDEHTIRYLGAAMTEHLRLKDFTPATITEVIPAGLEVQQEFGGFQAIYRWFSWMRMLASLVTAIFGLGVAALFWQPSPHEPPDIFVRLAPFALLLVALFGIYQSLVIALNRTTIEVSSERICVHHGPLPYPGNRSVACRDLEQLVVVEQEHKSDERATYELDAILKKGQTIKLWSNDTRERLDYLKQATERQLSRQNLTLEPAH